MARSWYALMVMALAAASPRAGAAQGRTELTWYGHAAFVVRTPRGTVLAIDPWLSNPKAKDKDAAARLDRVDYILVSHGHADHVGDAIAIARRTRALFVGSNELAQALMAAGYPMDPKSLTATTGNAGGTIRLTDELSVTFVPAVHSSGFKRDPQAPAEYGGSPLGFLVHVKGGPTIYHTGDTAAFSDLQLVSQRWPIDVMLACIGGHFTMDPVDAARMAEWARAKQVVPMHFGTYPVLAGTPAELERAIRASGGKSAVVEMKVGETRAF